MVDFWKPRLAPSGPTERYKRRLSAFAEQNRVALLGVFRVLSFFCLCLVCPGLVSATSLFGSGVSLLATLIGGLKHLFSSFALGRYAQAYFQPFCFLVRVLAY